MSVSKRDALRHFYALGCLTIGIANKEIVVASSRSIHRGEGCQENSQEGRDVFSHIIVFCFSSSFCSIVPNAYIPFW